MPARRFRLMWAALAVAAMAAPATAADPPVEDPALAAAFKAKGWLLTTDTHDDGKQYVSLLFLNPAKGLAENPPAPADYALIARSKAVQYLDLTRTANPTDAGLKLIAAMPRLEKLEVGGEKVTDAGLKALAALPNLRSLHLRFMTVDGSFLAAFAGSRTLEAVAFDNVDGLTDAGLKHLAKLPNLNALRVGDGKPTFTPAGVRAAIAARLPAKFEVVSPLIDDDLFTTLVAKGWLYGPSPPGDPKPKPATAADVRTINLDGSKVTDKGFAAVLPCVNVENLFLRRTGVTDVSLKKLAGFGKLSWLDLDGTKVTAAGLAAVAGPPLKRLSLERCELTEDAFKAVGRMRGLEWLSVAEAKGKTGGLKHLAGLAGLKELSVYRTDFDDAAARVVAGLPAVESVQAFDTRLTDAGFAALLKLPKLRTLSVNRTAVTAAAVERAKKDYPKVNISR